MWRPPERIKHTLPDPGWPSREEAQRALLFTPIRLGPIELETRTWVPAMVPWRASEEGYVTEHVLAWYERFARGRPGAIVVEATGVRDIPSGPLLRIGDDRFLPGLERLVETVRRASGNETRLLIQLIDFLRIRRRPKPESFFLRYLEITERHRQLLRMPDAPEDAVRRRLLEGDEALHEAVLNERELEALRYGYRERVTDTHLPHIRDLPRVLPEIFAAAARRALEAGFDGVELHYAHAYTMAGFLSALNTRSDGYGGDREERVRLGLEVYERVREAVGSRMAVGCRFLTEEIIPGGNTIADSAWFAQRFAAAGMDFLSLSRGGKFEDARQPRIGEAAYPYTGRSGYECMPTVHSDRRGPFGRNVEAAKAVRRAVRDAGYETPIVVAGGIAGFAQAEALLRDGACDIVASARQSLADPDWFLKTRLGLGHLVRRCRFTNYCEALDQKHQQVTCQLWDRLDLEQPGILRTSDGKRRAVAPDWEPPPCP